MVAEYSTKMRRELENFKAEHKSHGEKNNDISLSLVRDFNTRGFLFRVSILALFMTGIVGGSLD